MKSKYSVLRILAGICNNQSSRSEVNFLIELTHNYAYTYLSYRYKNLSRILMAEYATLDEMAIDAIASLFERDDFGCFIKLKTACENW